MLRLSDVRIGTKLMAMSGVGVLLVSIMIGVSLYANSNIKRSNGSALGQERTAHVVTGLQEAFVKVRVSVRNIRLSASPAELKAANNLVAQRDAVQSGFTKLIADLRLPENRDRAKQAQGYVHDYIAGALAKTLPTQEKIVALDPTKDGLRILSLQAETQRIQHEQLDPIADKAIDLLQQISTSASALAQKEVNAADAQMASAQLIGVGVGGAVVLILIGSAAFGAMSIARPLAKMAGVLVELTNDRIVDVPYVGRGDEIGDIAKATEIFRQSIAEKMINLRVRAGLDVVRSNMMIADDQYNIMYTNHALDDMMKEAAPELRKVLPNFDAGKLLGANIDVFHKNPAHQRKLLDQLTGTYETMITIGPLKFQLAATPVRDAHGKRAGTVVEWRNITMEKAIEAEVDQLVNAAVVGDFAQRVPLEGKKDFMLSLAKSMNTLCENTGAALEDLATMMSSLASGDLTKRITADYHGMFGKLKADGNAMADRLSATISEIKASTREVTNAAAEISTSTTDLSQRTEEQAASLEETSASMEEIAATVKKNAESAQLGNQSAAGTREVADRGGKVVAQAVEAMARIEDSSQKIADIIGVIDEIARQTNLLALNAAVEAARAGDAGRGFAVVASEVRSLAQRSSQAAKDIKDLIINSSGQVKEGVDLVNRAGAALTEIVDSIKSVAAIVSDIATASIEQATGIEQVNKALTQMDEVTQQNSALVEENAATAKTLETQAAALNEQVAFFRLDEARDVGRTQRPAVRQAAAAPVTAKPARAAAPAARPAAASTARRATVTGMQTALATAFDPEWKDF